MFALLRFLLLLHRLRLLDRDDRWVLSDIILKFFCGERETSVGVRELGHERRDGGGSHVLFCFVLFCFELNQVCLDCQAL